MNDARKMEVRAIEIAYSQSKAMKAWIIAGDEVLAHIGSQPGDVTWQRLVDRNMTICKGGEGSSQKHNQWQVHVKRRGGDLPHVCLLPQKTARLLWTGMPIRSKRISALLGYDSAARPALIFDIPKPQIIEREKHADMQKGSYHGVASTITTEEFDAAKLLMSKGWTVNRP